MLKQTFEIMVSRTVTATNVYTIEAESINDAFDLAEKLAMEDSFDYENSEPDYMFENI